MTLSFESEIEQCSQGSLRAETKFSLEWEVCHSLHGYLKVSTLY